MTDLEKLVMKLLDARTAAKEALERGDPLWYERSLREWAIACDRAQRERLSLANKAGAALRALMREAKRIKEKGGGE